MPAGVSNNAIFSPDIWAWASNSNNKAAVAPCFAKDIFEMGIVRSNAEYYFTVGRVPCLYVCLYGIIVAIDTWEKRTIYQVDDGTATVECVVRHTDEKEPPLPAAKIADTVRVIGAVLETTRRGRPTRNIICSILERSNSNQDEVDHWNKVLDLHDRSYDLSIPFIIPPIPKLPIVHPDSHTRRAPSPVPSPTSTARLVLPKTPTAKRTRRRSPSLARSDVSTVASATSSPTRPTAKGPSSQSKLPHPLRVRHEKVTQERFREYLRYYMEKGPPLNEDEGYDSENRAPSPRTPTTSCTESTEYSTPRPSKRQRIDSALHDLETPRPRRRSAKSQPDDHMRGFTLSHLRRVPELAMMAKKLYKKEHGEKATERAAPILNRYWETAMNELRMRGMIILWAGPNHPLPRSTSRVDTLWDMGKKYSQADVSRSSAASFCSWSSQADLDSSLCEQCDDEDAYIVLTTEHLSKQILKTIDKLTMPDPPKIPGLRTFRKRGPTIERITAVLKEDECWRQVCEYDERAGS